MSNTKPEKWEGIFMKEVVYPHNQNRKNRMDDKGKEILITGFDVVMVNKTKSFIHKLLAKERKNLEEEAWASHIDEINKEDGGKYETYKEAKAFNEALDLVISFLNSQK
jgi:hypothetical protein